MAKFKTDTERILEAISNHGSTFTAFCGEYTDTPDRGDREGWSALFRKLAEAEVAGYIEIDRNDDRRIETLTLTESGTAKLSELRAKVF